MKTIIEVFNFLHELDLLEAHLDEHQHFIDKFVVLESKVTYSGMSKPLIFAENRERFKRFNIIYEEIPVDMFTPIPGKYPEEDHKKWFDIRRNNRETQQTYLFNKYKHEADYIANSDVDEIWDRNRWDKIYSLMETDHCYIAPVVKHFYFYVDCPGRSDQAFRITKSDQHTHIRQKGTKRSETKGGVGWHFSNCYKDMKDLWYKGVGLAQSAGYRGWEMVPTPDEMRAQMAQDIAPLWNQKINPVGIMPLDGLYLPEFIRNNRGMFPWAPDSIRNTRPIYGAE